MFGCVVAGRLLQTNLTQVDDTHAYFQLPNASNINHLTVFLLGTIPFPNGYGATVHFYWPGKGFQMLGMLSNEKPSAIFRLRGTFHLSSSPAHTAFSSMTNPDGIIDGPEVIAILGLAIEPLPSIESQVALMPQTIARNAANAGVPDPTLLAEKIVKHLFNYVAGFTGGVSADSAVPMNVIQKWYDNFLGKLRAGGVGFLERGD